VGGSVIDRYGAHVAAAVGRRGAIDVGQSMLNFAVNQILEEPALLPQLGHTTDLSDVRLQMAAVTSQFREPAGHLSRSSTSASAPESASGVASESPSASMEVWTTAGPVIIVRTSA